MGSGQGTRRTGRALALWLLVLAQLGAGWWLGERIWWLRWTRYQDRTNESMRLVAEGCGRAAGGCLMDPLLLLGDEWAIMVLDYVKGGGNGLMGFDGPEGEAVIHWLVLESSLTALVAGFDGDPTTYDIPTNLSRPFPGLDTLIDVLEQTLAAPNKPVGLRRAALAALQRCADDHARRAAQHLVDDPSTEPELLADAQRVMKGKPLERHERSALAALLRLPHDCQWNGAP